MEPKIEIENTTRCGREVTFRFVVSPGDVRYEVPVLQNAEEFMMQEAWQELFRILNSSTGLDKRLAGIALDKSRQWEQHLISKLTTRS